jgi:hypothetical protein
VRACLDDLVIAL